MRNWFKRTLHPAWYHGHGKSPPFFEGWYYKLVGANGKARYAIIPGVFLHEDPAEAHAFVQILDGRSGDAAYHRYPASLFWAAQDAFDVRIGPNHFTAQHVNLQIDDEQGSVRGRLHFEGLKPWPVSVVSPGIMGWYAWVPFMECYHGVLSLDHSISGELTIGGRSVDLTGGRGYIEKDWGAAFPTGYVWMQSNHFGEIGTSFTASIAVIPWLGGSFPGVIAGLWHEDRLYSFTTYQGAVTEKLEIDDDQVRWVIRQKRRQLWIRASRAQGGLIYGPDRASMGQRIGETMLASIELELMDWETQERILFRGTGRHAGLEVHGEVERLLVR